MAVALAGIRRVREIEENLGTTGWMLSSEMLDCVDEMMKGAAGVPDVVETWVAPRPGATPL